MEEFDIMINSSECASKGLEMVFVHNINYDLKIYKEIPCLKHLSVKKGLAYLLEKKHYDNMFI